MIRTIAAFALVLLLAACNDKQPVPAARDDQRNAEGEVLGGTISDAMLPLDTVTSQAPPLRESSKSDAEGPGAKGGSASSAPSASEPAAESSGAPAASPSPSAAPSG
jgi:hypothetical protein